MKKILILMIDIGSGHKMPAFAVKDKLEKIENNIQVEVIDVLNEFGGQMIHKVSSKMWNLALSNPRMFKPIWHLTNHDIMDFHTFERVLLNTIANNLSYYLKGFKPDIVFSTHNAGSATMGILKKKKKTDRPSVLLITDAFCAHPIWRNRYQDYYIMYDTGIFPKLTKKGVKDNQLLKTNFPLREIFDKTDYSKKEITKIKEKEHIYPNLQTVTFMAGGEGIGNAPEIISQVLKDNLPINLIAICGKNRKVFQKIKKLETIKSRTNLITKGFVSNVHELLAISDITMGKSGISFTFESMVMGKPFLITQTMENEAPAKEYVINNELGWYISSKKEISQFLSGIKPELIKKYSDNINSIGFQNGAKEIAEFLLSKIK
jgi:processive 1,2-diacylglycerol beta-glucosyltransferase